MLIKLANGTVYDPINQIDGKKMDIYVRDGKIVSGPNSDEKVDQEYNLTGQIVMAGAIDPHTHIGGGKVTIARILVPEDHQIDPVAGTELTRPGCGHAVPSTLTTGYRYAEMGYTAGFEPAMLPINSRQAHMEMADIPILDKGGYVMLGSDDMFLRMLAAKNDQEAINDYVAWTIHSAQALAVKVVNPGGISAFKFNQRKLDLDEQHAFYGVTPRQVLQTLSRAVKELGVTHSLHVHGCNLGVPGSAETTINTITGMSGLPIHMTHLQFHSYGTEGDFKFSSGAPKIAEAVNANPNVSIDVGQIMFGQTCTASGDSQRQYAGTPNASPKKYVVMDIECDAGCGVVPFKYRDKSYVHALQWCIGMELFLLVNDPWRVFLTTDHPNGGPFMTYPHLIKLLMDKSFRRDMFSKLNPQAAAMSTVGSIDREYSLYEIAILTRGSPAKSLGLRDCGHVGAGARADITVYNDHPDKEKMFTTPAYVFKDGELIVRDGKLIKITQGATHVVKPEFDRGIEKKIKDYFQRFHTMQMDNFRISDDEIVDGGRGRLNVQPCQPRTRL